MSKAATAVMKGFAEDFAVFQAENKDLIDSLTAEVGEAKTDDLFWSLIDELKGVLSARAANQCVGEKGANKAILAVEQWVAEEYSPKVSVVPLILLLHGRVVGAKHLREAIQSSKAA